MNWFSSRLRLRKKVDYGLISIILFLSFLGAFMFLPLLFLVSTAFKPMEELFLYPPRFLVSNPTLDNFKQLILATSMDMIPFTRYVFNSLLVVGVTVVFTILLGSLASYPLAKHKFPGRGFTFSLIVTSLMFAPEVVEIPRYLVVNYLGLVDTYSALILPNLAFPIGLFLMKQFLEQVPDEIFEAAKIDGANEWTMFLKIALPLIRPAWVTVVILSFVGVWNDASSSTLFTQSEAMKTLPYYMSTINGQGAARIGANAAATLLMTLPGVLIFVLFQRKVMSTLAYSGIKS
ncbi:carbohydrate ABC transporter permease [Paenibacillus eucommiae]|uniref:ABC-type glycerol-3-phosphate transport system permease component n=1 Tax=Paenibacillus eucommiae TaxID=1355755 RepID=A0ABS4ILN5_9BACL|nr:carbohydrate ABC transporter permease [Paenibacillus eucommiae]MBP1988485.1 ABC-type glycerol-3-phosphate transport system permease component [Paenibacillus eucommiae]